MEKSSGKPPEHSAVVEGFGAVGHLLQWFAPPDSWQLQDGLEEGRGGAWDVATVPVAGGTMDAPASSSEARDNQSSASSNRPILVLHPPSKKDYWRKTYYEPLLVKDDGPFLYAKLSVDERYTVDASFAIHARHQFDQAGIMIRLDHDHWIKTGIEVVDGRPRLSVVVTNCYSDWSTQAWNTYRAITDPKDVETTVIHVSARVRVHCRGTSFVIEAQMENGQWEFVRICHLSRNLSSKDDPLDAHPTTLSAWKGPSASQNELWVGIFGACPLQSGARIEFSDFRINKGSTFDHNADDNHEEALL